MSRSSAMTTTMFGRVSFPVFRVASATPVDSTVADNAVRQKIFLFVLIVSCFLSLEKQLFCLFCEDTLFIK